MPNPMDYPVFPPPLPFPCNSVSPDHHPCQLSFQHTLHQASYPHTSYGYSLTQTEVWYDDSSGPQHLPPLDSEWTSEISQPYKQDDEPEQP